MFLSDGRLLELHIQGPYTVVIFAVRTCTCFCIVFSLVTWSARIPILDLRGAPLSLFVSSSGASAVILLLASVIQLLPSSRHNTPEGVSKCYEGFHVVLNGDNDKNTTNQTRRKSPRNSERTAGQGERMDGLYGRYRNSRMFQVGSD